MPPRVAVITALYGTGYETSLKPVVPQTLPCDLICFTDVPETELRRPPRHPTTTTWDVDRTPYHDLCPSRVDARTTATPNSLANNRHTFNVAKYYKQSFHNIPRLRDGGYDIVVWLDATVEVTHPRLVETCADLLLSRQRHRSSLSSTSPPPLVSIVQEKRGGVLAREVEASARDDKYRSTRWFGQAQPFQDVRRQYEQYLQRGFREGWAKETTDDSRAAAGIWTTCLVAFDMRHPGTLPFLDDWYLQTLRHTTQDQVSFPFVCWSRGTRPASLPDIATRNENAYMRRHPHGR